MENVRLPRPAVIEHRGSSFISVSQRRWDGSGREGAAGGSRGEGGYCWVLKGSEGPALPFLKVYLSKGSPTALVYSVNVLTLLTSPGTLGLIHTLKEVQQQCQGGRGVEGE